MTPADVKTAVKQIKERQGDYEAAHAMEDMLYLEALKAIASGNCDDPQAIAKEAIKTQRLGFARYCA